MADNTVEIAIKAVDQTNAAIESSKRQLASLTGAAQTAGTNAGKGLSQGFVVSEREIGQAISRINPMLGSIVTAVGPVGIALASVTAGVVLFNKTWELAEQGAAASELADKFVEITGGISASEQMMQKLRQATKGTVTDMELQILANRSLNMGVTQNVDEMARLAAYFQELGDASGMGSKEAVSAGMQALGALQVRGFKTLGLSLDDTKIYDAYADKLGTVASKLDDVQKKAALTQELLSRAPQGLVDAIGSSADKAEAMHVSITNLNIEIGRSIEKMLGLGDSITYNVNVATHNLAEARTKKEIGTDYMLIADQMRASGMAEEAAKIDNAIRQLDNDWGLANRTAADYARILGEASPATAAFVAAQEATASGIQNTSYYTIALAGQMYELGNAVRSIPNYVGIQIDYFASGMPVPSRLGAGDYPTASLSDPTQMGMRATGTGSGAKYFANPVDISIPAKSVSGGGGGGGGGSSAAAWESDMRAQSAELRSMTEAALKPSYRGPDDLVGPYIEQWDEYARKMNAIADDSDTMWRKMVPQDILDQGQEAIAKWAREEEKAFYAGERIGEVDWAKFVEDAKKQVELQQAKEDMIAMGMRKLAEAGIGGVNAAEVLGLNAPGAKAGAEMSTSFTSGLVSSDTALAVTMAFQTQMTNQQAVWQSVGVLCIGWFVAGVTGGITPNVGKAIAMAMFPFLKPLMGDPVQDGLRGSGL